MQKPHHKVFPCFCRHDLPKSTNSAQVHGWYVLNSVTSGAPWVLWGWPPWVLSCSAFTFAAQRASLPSGDPQSHNIHHHHPLLPCCQRCWALQDHEVLALTPIYVGLALPSVSVHCTPAQHHREHCPYSPSGQWENPPYCVSSSLCCLLRQKGTCRLQHLSNALWWTIHHLPVFHRSPHWEGHSHTAPYTVRWPLAGSIQWSLRLLYPLAGWVSCQVHQLLTGAHNITTYNLSPGWHGSRTSGHAIFCALMADPVGTAGTQL